MSIPMGKTLGDLTAYDLGREVEFADGGATYRGILTSADHKEGYGDRGPRTCVVLKADNWQHIKSYPSETRVDVRPPVQETP